MNGTSNVFSQVNKARQECLPQSNRTVKIEIPIRLRATNLRSEKRWYERLRPRRRILGAANAI